MRTLRLLVGNATTRRHTVRSQHAVRVEIDGVARGRNIMTMSEARTYAAILSQGCRAIGVDFTTSFPASPQRPTLLP